MEVEDALSAKFRTLIEGLMVTTSAEIVKMFSKVLMETRVEISRSWREIDLLKQKLEECELEKTEAIFRAQRLSDFKREDDEVEVSHMVSQPDSQSTSTARPQAGSCEDRAEIASVRNRGAGLGNAKASGPDLAQPINTAAPDHHIKKVCVAENSPCRNKETHGTQTVDQLKLVCPANTSIVKGETSSVDKTVPQPSSNTIANGPSSSVGTLTVSLQSKEMKAVVRKRKLIKKNKHANDIISVARALRDRQHLSMHRRCLCCPADECYLQLNPTKAHHQVPTVYICRKCEKRFKTHVLFKSHKCKMPQSCSMCGQTFSTVQGLSAHIREVRPQFSCAHCGQTFTTQCAWNLHEKIHTNSTSVQNIRENTVDALSTNAVSARKDIKAKLEVRLERISDTQLEAALCTKNALQNDPAASKPAQYWSETGAVSGPVCSPGAEYALVNVPETSKAQESSFHSVSQSVAESLDLGPGTAPGSSVTSDVRKVYAVMSTSACQMQMNEDSDSLQSQTSHGSDIVMDDGKHASEGDESGAGSCPKKWKMSECSHDAYNGVFPVEKILRCRINKGRKEVRVKWMPCSMCGAHFQNTWEPVESFPGYLDDKNEEPKEEENTK